MIFILYLILFWSLYMFFSTLYNLDKERTESRTKIKKEEIGITSNSSSSITAERIDREPISSYSAPSLSVSNREVRVFDSLNATLKTDNEKIQFLLNDLKSLERSVLYHPLYNTLTVGMKHSMDVMRTDYTELMNAYMEVDKANRPSQDELVIGGLRNILERMEQVNRTLVTKSFSNLKRKVNVINQRDGAD